MRYLYYTTYRLMLQIKTNDTAAFNAMFFLTICEGLNIQTIMLLLPLKKFESQFFINDQVIIFAIIPCLILMIINYFLYVKKANGILEHYKDESKRSKTLGVALLVFYFIISFVAIFTVSDFQNKI